MFCENCGNKIQNGYKFCTKCGNSTVSGLAKNSSTIRSMESSDKWYLRFAKVIYIIFYIPLPFALYGIWTSNDPYSYYNSYSREYDNFGSYGEAFWYTLLTLVIWVVVLRLTKIAFLYIAVGRKPEWKNEFKKLF